jgi:dipeptidyl aminopeptidase/acylaminoacyl peptidase
MFFAARFSWWPTLSLPGSPGPHLAYRQITFIGNAIMPAISPDGKFVAYVTAKSESKQKLMMQALSGGPSLELQHGRRVLNPRWSPDGSELMVRVRDDDETRRGIFLVSRLGGAPRPLGEALSYSCWLPDESQVVAASRDPETRIWLVNSQSGLEKQLPAPRYSWLHDIDCSAKTACCSFVPRRTKNISYGR